MSQPEHESTHTTMLFSYCLCHEEPLKLSVNGAFICRTQGYASWLARSSYYESYHWKLESKGRKSHLGHLRSLFTLVLEYLLGLRAVVLAVQQEPNEWLLAALARTLLGGGGIRFLLVFVFSLPLPAGRLNASGGTVAPCMIALFPRDFFICRRSQSSWAWLP